MVVPSVLPSVALELASIDNDVYTPDRAWRAVMVLIASNYTIYHRPC